MYFNFTSIILKCILTHCKLFFFCTANYSLSIKFIPFFPVVNRVLASLFFVQIWNKSTPLRWHVCHDGLFSHAKCRNHLSFDSQTLMKDDKLGLNWNFHIGISEMDSANLLSVWIDSKRYNSGISIVLTHSYGYDMVEMNFTKIETFVIKKENSNEYV